MLEIILSGGWLMAPILLCSVLTLTIIVERFWTLQRKKVVPALNSLYDEIWVYGSKSIANPIQGIDISGETRQKMHYLGYLKRELPPNGYMPRDLKNSSYLLFTTGGGGDGEMLVDWVVRAYEKAGDGQILPGVIVLGPFMSKAAQDNFNERIRKIPALQAKIFDSHIEVLIANATGVVAMGGYNTFCEILSYNKKAIVVPRETPRLEQRIRADYASSHGLMKMLTYDNFENTDLMIESLAKLPNQLLPSAAGAEELLNGLPNINIRVGDLLLKP